MRTRPPLRVLSVSIAVLFGAACHDNGANAPHDLAAAGALGDLAPAAPDLMPSPCSGATPSQSTAGPAPSAMAGLTVPAGFALQKIAAVGAARELAALPNGDLLVATEGNDVYIVPNAEASGAAGAPVVYTSIADSPTQGLAFDAASCTVFIATQHGVYRVPYADGQLTASAAPVKIASVRSGIVAPGSDGDIHTTSSVTVGGDKVFVGVGSSCNACVETDPTRATVQQMGRDGTGMSTRATRFRNAIALAINPATGTLWAGGAGQDGLALGHPYEFFDAVGLHAGVADYGWPACEENQHAYVANADCTGTIAPVIELPAYSTIIGAVFYPALKSGDYAFPAASRGLYLTSHGSWHMTGSTYYTAPRVAFVAMNGDAPVMPVDWSDPSKQWKEVIGGFQLADGVTRIARPTGIAVGSKGSLFVGDDQNGSVYRIRPQ